MPNHPPLPTPSHQSPQSGENLDPVKNWNGISYQQPQLTGNLKPEKDGDDDEISLDLGQLFQVLRRRWWLIVSVALAVSLGVTGYSWWKPTYEEKFQLLVEPDQGATPSLPIAAPGIGSILGFTSKEDVYFATQIKVLSSYQLIAPLLPKIQQRFPASEGLIVSLLPKRQHPEKEELKYEAFVEKVKINRLPETQLIEVRYQDTSPEKVKFVLEQLAQTYLDYSLKETKFRKGQGLEFVEQELPKLQARVAQLQEQIQRFSQKYNFIDPSSQRSILTSSFTNITQQLQENRAQLQQLTAVYEELRQELGIDRSQAIALTTLSESPRYMKLLDRLREIDTELASESTRFTGSNPVIRKLQEERQNLLPLLEQEARAALADLPGGGSPAVRQLASPNTIRLQLLQELLRTSSQLKEQQTRRQVLVEGDREIRQQIRNLATLSRQYGDLQRELQIANENLIRLLATQQSLQIETAKRITPWRLVSPVRAPEKPTSSLLKMAVLGSFLGLVLGMGAALLADRLDDTLHTPEQIKQLTRSPLLGAIPRQQGLEQANFLSPQAQLPGPFLEAFLSLQANLSLLSSKGSPRSLTITSPVPEDGKSTVAVHLALAAALMGKKVLLVDGDFRAPTLHQRLGLAGKTVASWEDILQSPQEKEVPLEQFPGNDNLFLLGVRGSSLNAPSLLSSRRLSELLAQWQEQFDAIVFDAPPLLGLADAKLLAARTDGLLLVVRLEQTKREMFQEALQEVKSAQLPLLGVVANGVNPQTLKASASYKRYLQMAAS